MKYRELMRKQLLNQIYEKMSDEEKRTFVQLTLQNKSHEEIMDALNHQQQTISHIAEKIEKQNWVTDFVSDVGANILTDSLLLIGRKVLGRH